MRIKNIIFDLGGVVLDLDQGKTLRSFKRLGSDLDEINHEDSVFIDYELGKITEEFFMQSLFTYLKGNASREQIKDAWNAMLLDLPQERIELLRQLKKHYRLFLLSNTNHTHIEEVYRSHGKDIFNELFEIQFLSFEMGSRKPMLACYEQVLVQAEIKASESVFIDDSRINIKGATLAGLQTILANEPIGKWLGAELKKLEVTPQN
jgi:putative hydrolase of the HAD superfamily